LVAPQTMVVEFPLAGCVAKSASAASRAKMTSAKAALLKACGKTHLPSNSVRKLAGTATITGVGFFDKSHGVCVAARRSLVLPGRARLRTKVPKIS